MIRRTAESLAYPKNQRCFECENRTYVKKQAKKRWVVLKSTEHIQSGLKFQRDHKQSSRGVSRAWSGCGNLIQRLQQQHQSLPVHKNWNVSNSTWDWGASFNDFHPYHPLALGQSKHRMDTHLPFRRWSWVICCVPPLGCPAGPHLTMAPLWKDLHQVSFPATWWQNGANALISRTRTSKKIAWHWTLNVDIKIVQTLVTQHSP